MSAADRLRYYAEHFGVVEVDSTYYRPLEPALAGSWAERVPEGFRFDVKAYGLFTGHPVLAATLWPDIRGTLAPEAASKRRVYAHHLPADALDEAWARFLHALEPLAVAGRLGAVLFQYPPWFVPSRDNRAEVERLAQRLQGVIGCVEFRSPRWYGSEQLPRTLAMLSSLNLAFVVVDAPSVSGLPTVPEVTTGRLAVARFHGRADSTWSARNLSAAERFRYLYDRKELEQWVPRARLLAEKAETVHLLMNNCYRDYGVRNAAELASLLDEAGN